MRSRRPSPEHEQAVARRLALLSAELAAVRAGQPGQPGEPEQPPAQGSTPDPSPVEDPDPAAPWEWGQHTRVRPAAESAVPEAPDLLPHPDSVPHPGSLPHPGRHAARRGSTSGWLPVRGGVTLQPAHLAVVALLVALGLGWTTWWVVVSEPRTSPVPSPGDATPVAAAPSGADPAGLTPAGGAGRGLPTGGGAEPGVPASEVVVDVAGRVRRPGLVVLPTGSRVADALEAAGGPRRGVDLVSLNLARLLVDGEQLLVGIRPPGGVAGPASPGPGAPPGAAGTASGLVNLNTADEALLDTLPGVGPVTAAAIVAWRTEHGGFTAVDELLEVNGIGEVTLAELAPLVTV